MKVSFKPLKPLKISLLKGLFNLKLYAEKVKYNHLPQCLV